MKRSSFIRFYLIFSALIISAFTITEEKSAYLPIVLVAGINADHVNMEPMAELIKKHLPGVYVKNLQIGLGKITSFWNMHDQAEWLAHALYDDYNLRNGCNIIAHSQGGLTARYFVQRYNYPRVYNYISLGSPQRGIEGIPTNIDNQYMWLNLCESYVSNILYLSIFQQCVSFAGYWNDSLRHSEYLDKCSFLPYLNNEKPHEFSDLFKENICKLQNMVLVQAIEEDIVEPADSCHFGFYRKGSMYETEDLFASDIYAHDTLGLKYLYTNNRLHLKEARCNHDTFKSDEQNFVENVLPFLTLDPNTLSVAYVDQETESAIEA